MSSGGKTQASVGHVCIEVSNLRNSRKFYEALLGKLDFKAIMDTKEIKIKKKGDVIQR
jgi:catechol-2,3-dioxygenase